MIVDILYGLMLLPSDVRFCMQRPNEHLASRAIKLLMGIQALTMTKVAFKMVAYGQPQWVTQHRDQQDHQLQGRAVQIRPLLDQQCS